MSKQGLIDPAHAHTASPAPQQRRRLRDMLAAVTRRPVATVRRSQIRANPSRGLPGKVITRRDVVDRVNDLIRANNTKRRGPYLAPPLRYKAWPRAVSIARQRKLFPPDVLRAVAKHGAYDPTVTVSIVDQASAA